MGNNFFCENYVVKIVQWKSAVVNRYDDVDVKKYIFAKECTNCSVNTQIAFVQFAFAWKCCKPKHQRQKRCRILWIVTIRCMTHKQLSALERTNKIALFRCALETVRWIFRYVIFSFWTWTQNDLTKNCQSTFLFISRNDMIGVHIILLRLSNLFDMVVALKLDFHLQWSKVKIVHFSVSLHIAFASITFLMKKQQQCSRYFRFCVVKMFLYDLSQILVVYKSKIQVVSQIWNVLKWFNAFNHICWNVWHEYCRCI